jgi:hypothetical protein
LAALPAKGARTTSCNATPVHYEKDAAADPGLRSLPWLATEDFHAHLFYWGGTPWLRSHPARARIFTTVKTRVVQPKVLWTALRAQTAPTLRISGTRLDARGHFTFVATRVNGNQFPSYVAVPHAGCWRVDVRSGKLAGSVTFAAVDSF